MKHIGQPVVFKGDLICNMMDVQAAMITGVWDGSNRVNLIIFPDQQQPQARSSVLFFESQVAAEAHRPANFHPPVCWPAC
jgi:hypothetical protein